MPNRLDPITGELENTSSVATFDELKEWYNSTKEGRTLWKGRSSGSGAWAEGFIRFYQVNGFVPVAGNSIYIRTDVNTALRGGSPLYLNKSTNPNVVKEFGTTPSAPIWNKGSAVTGNTSGSLTGGTARVGQQLVETKINESTEIWETATVGGTIVGTMTLGDLLLGSALGIGLGVKFVDFFPDQATDFSNFCLLPMINYGIIDPAEYETTRVGLTNVLREHNDEQGNKLITPYAPIEAIQKGLEYLLKIGAFKKGIIINSHKPNKGTGLSYSIINDDIYKSTIGYLSDYIWNLIPTDNDYNNLREHKDDIVSLLISKLGTIFTGIKSDCLYEFRFAIKTNIHKSPVSSNFWYNWVAMAIYERPATNLSALDVSTVRDVQSNTVEPFNTDAYTFQGIGKYNANHITEYRIVINKFNDYEDFQNKILSATPVTQEKTNSTTSFGSTFADNSRLPDGSVGYFPYNKVGLWVQGQSKFTDGTDTTLYGADVSIGTVNTDYSGGTSIKGLQFTDYTPLINDINDLTTRLQDWKNKNGWKVSVPSYDENGKPNGVRDQWYLPIPTPNPSAKTSPDYTTPTGLYEPTNVPDNDPNLQDEILDRLKDIENQLPSNPEYKPTPTPPSDDTGEINTPSSILGNNGQGLWSVYNPSLSQINEFGAWLWSSDIWEQIKQFFSDPMQGIIGLHKIYCKPTNGDTKTIIAGYLDSRVSSPTVTKQYERIDCGSLACAEYYGSALDYSPFTDVAIYLPFVGVVNLNVNEVMGSILHVYYDVDILTGACLATIEVKDSSNTIVSLYQYNGVCAVQIPLTSGNYGSVIASLVTTGAGVVATVASGGALAPVLIGGAVSALNSGANIKQSGSIGSNVGAMAQKKPYLIISRKIPYMALNYNNFEGFPSNNNVYIGNLTGYVRTRKVYIASNIATQNEKEMIEELLNGGVYI